MSSEHQLSLSPALALGSLDQSRPFPFMELPTDLRLEIYEHTINAAPDKNEMIPAEIIQTDQGKDMSTRQSRGRSRRKNKETFKRVVRDRFKRTRHNRVPPLLAVSHQVRNEATWLFWRNKRVEIHIKNWGPYPGYDPTKMSLRHIPWLRTLDATNTLASLHQISMISDVFDSKIDIDLCNPNSLDSVFRDDAFSFLRFETREDAEKLEQLRLLPYLEKSHSFFPSSQRSTTELLRVAQVAMDEFVKLCGEGKQVRPTIEGLEILARALFAVNNRRPQSPQIT